MSAIYIGKERHRVSRSPLKHIRIRNVRVARTSLVLILVLVLTTGCQFPPRTRGWMGRFGQFVCRRGWLAPLWCPRSFVPFHPVGSILYERRSVSRVFLFAFVRFTDERRESRSAKLAPIRFVWHCAAPRKVRGTFWRTIHTTLYYLLENRQTKPYCLSWKSKQYLLPEN